VRSLAYRPANPASWVNACNKPIGDRTLPSSELGTPVCAVFLHRSDTGFIGTTPREGCPTQARGAVRITNQIELTPTGMNTWDRGFNAEGQQVWGAQSDSYQFRKLP
jgi:hypothetical protein